MSLFPVSAYLCVVVVVVVAYLCVMSLCQQRLAGHWQLIVYFRDVRAKENEKEGDTILALKEYGSFIYSRNQFSPICLANTDTCMEFIDFRHVKYFALINLIWKL